MLRGGKDGRQKKRDSIASTQTIWFGHWPGIVEIQGQASSFLNLK